MGDQRLTAKKKRRHAGYVLRLTLLAAILSPAFAASDLHAAVSLDVDAVDFVERYGAETPSQRFLVVSVTIRNGISPELVFDHDFDERILLDNLRAKRVFLDWNGETTLALQERLQAQPGHLPDTVELAWEGDKVSGQLVFEVPADPPDHARLILVDDRFGPVSVDVIGSAPASAAPSSNADAEIMAEIVETLPAEADGDERVRVRLEGRAGRAWSPPPPLEANGLRLPLELSGLRLYADGENPITADGEPRVVLLPDHGTTHELVFDVPADAPNLALVLPLPPPAGSAASGEPYWILPLRGEAPTLAGTASPPHATTTASSRTPTATPPAETPAPGSSRPSLPPAPVLAPLNPAIAAETAARLVALRERPMPARPTVTVSTSRDGAPTITPGQFVAANFADGDYAHFFRLALGEPATQLSELLLAPELGVRLTMSLWQGDQRVSTRSDDELSHLRTGDHDLLVEVTNSGRKPADYRLLWERSDTVAADREFEPNDELVERLLPRMRSEAGRFVLHGQLSGADDVDFFIIDADDAAIATLELRAAEGDRRGQLRMQSRSGETILYGGDTSGDRRHLLPDVYLLPGTNVFSVGQGTGEYTVNATLQPVPGPDYEREPNDTPAFAQRLAVGETRYGRLPTNRDKDVYGFFVHARTPLRLIAVGGDGAPLSATLERSGDKLPRLGPAPVIDETLALAPGHYTLELAPGNPAALALYSLRLDHAPIFAADGVTNPSIRLRFEAERSTAAPFHDRPQLLRGRLRIENAATAAAQLALEGQATHLGVHVVFGSNRIDVAPGQSLDVPVELRIGRDVQADGPIRVEFAARNGKGTAATAWTLGTPIDALPTADTWQDLPLPHDMLGGLDVAAVRFGAEAVSPSTASTLLQGLDTRSDVFRGSEAVVRLAGERPARLVGGIVASQIRSDTPVRLDVEASLDGAVYRPVFSGIVELGFEDQVFRFPAPVEAAFVRARFSTGSTGTPQVGSLSLVASPSTPLFPEGANLASLDNGWHVIVEEPGRLIAGFHHGREASVASVLVETASGEDPGKIVVEVSIAGPFGPWQSIATVSAGQPWQSGDAFRARYLRFSGAWQKPDDIRVTEVRERVAGEGYRSILGEWGGHDALAGQEVLAAAGDEAFERRPGSASRPEALAPGSPIDGVVWRDQSWEDAYRLDVPEGSQTVELVLAGPSALRAALEVTGGDGRAVTLQAKRQPGGREARYVVVDPPAVLNVHVYEPIRHVAIVWDDSGSLAFFRPGLTRLLRNFADDLDPRIEKVQLTPLHGATTKDTFLLEDWTGDRHLVHQALSRYRATNSSAAYKTLDAVLDGLARVDGNRILLVLTDDDGDRIHYGDDIDKELNEVGATVFSFHALAVRGSKGINNEHIDNLQTWAAIGGGRYTLLREPHELESAVARVQSWLRRPSAYRLSVATSTERPALGVLRVELARGSGSSPVAPRGIEVILDASGSMLQRMPGSGARRIDVAKQVLRDLVSSGLPDDTAFALRVFGHREADSCRTDLEIPYALLDRATAQQTIDGLNAINLAKTPIAASLEAVASDLGEEGKGGVVVLVTDGEETCDGNPTDAIRQLASLGFDVQVNIVGFAIDDANLKRQFEEWATLGGGSYFDTGDDNELARAIERSLLPIVDVLDAAGQTVAAGRVGEDIELPAGRYTAKLRDGGGSAPVEVEPGGTTTVEVDAE